MLSYINISNQVLIKSLLLAVSLVLFISQSVSASDEKHEDKYLTANSLMGEYVLIATGDSGNSGPESLTGVLRFNGNNNFTGVLISNKGASLGDRVSNTVGINGTYTIETFGRGVLNITNFNESAIFIVTETEFNGGLKKATAISFVFDSLSESGNLISGVIKQRKRKYDYNNRSLDGDYAFISNPMGGLDDAIAIGNVNFNSKISSVEGSFTINLPVVPKEDVRFLFDFLSAGPYLVNPDGTGTTISETTGGSSRFIVTRSEKYMGRERAIEIYFVPEFLDPVGNFNPSYMTRIDSY